MKNLFLTFALLISSMVFAQKPVLDSIQVYAPMPNPKLMTTLYEYNDIAFDKELTKAGNEADTDVLIVVFFYKESEDGEQLRKTMNFTRKPKK